MNKVYKIAIVTTHPVQYYAPLFRKLASLNEIELTVYYCHRQSKKGQADAGFGVEFDWDVDLLDGYSYRFLDNRSENPGTDNFSGCDTPEIYSLVKNEKYDGVFVFGWYVKSFWQTFFACWRTGTRLFVRGDSQLNDSLRKYLKYPLYRLFIPRFNGCLYVGGRSKEYYEFFGAGQNRLFYSPHCVDNEYFYNNSQKTTREKTDLRNKLNIDPDSFLVVFAGKFIQKKNPMHFVKAVEKASKNNKKIAGLMIGDGELREQAEAYVNEKSLPVVFTGFINQAKLPEYYSVSELLVLPSDYGETWGLVVNEAMACGVPAVVSDRAGCSADLIVDGETGFVFKYGNIDDLAEKIIRIAEDSDMYKDMKKNSINLVSDYNLNAAAEGFLQALK